MWWPRIYWIKSVSQWSTHFIRRPIFKMTKAPARFPQSCPNPKKYSFEFLMFIMHLIEKSTNFGFEQGTQRKLHDFEHAFYDDWRLASEGKNHKKSREEKLEKYQEWRNTLQYRHRRLYWGRNELYFLQQFMWKMVWCSRSWKNLCFFWRHCEDEQFKIQVIPELRKNKLVLLLKSQKSDYQIVFDEKTDIQIVDEDPNIIKQKSCIKDINFFISL